MHLMNYHHSSSCISSKQTGMLPVASPTNCRKPCCYAAEYGVLQKDLHNKKKPFCQKSFRINRISYSFGLMTSYSRTPRPIFSACSRQERHSEFGVELVNGSPQSAKPGLRRLSQSWLFGSAV